MVTYLRKDRENKRKLNRKVFVKLSSSSLKSEGFCTAVSQNFDWFKIIFNKMFNILDRYVNDQ